MTMLTRRDVENTTYGQLGEVELFWIAELEEVCIESISHLKYQLVSWLPPIQHVVGRTRTLEKAYEMAENELAKWLDRTGLQQKFDELEE